MESSWFSLKIRRQIWKLKRRQDERKRGNGAACHVGGVVFRGCISIHQVGPAGRLHRGHTLDQAAVSEYDPGQEGSASVLERRSRLIPVPKVD